MDTKKVAATITAETSITEAELGEMADTLFAETREMSADDAAAHAYAQYKEFMQAYPIVVRYICDLREYDPAVFRAWLAKIAKAPWTTEAEYLAAQADYVVMSRRHRAPNSSAYSLRRLRKRTVKMLTAELGAFKDEVETQKKIVEAREAERHARNRAELAAFVAKIGVAGVREAEMARVLND